MRTFKIIAGALLLMLIGALLSPAAQADYYGARWAGTTVCVQNQVDSPAVRQAVAAAVKDMRDQTDLHVVNYGSSSCVAAGHTQIVYVVDGSYSAGWVGYTDFNGMDWGRTPGGKWTYLLRSGIVIKLNTRFDNTAGGWQHIAVHELAHAVGLGHTQHTCSSVVTQLDGCGWKVELTRTDVQGSQGYPGINTIYSW